MQFPAKSQAEDKDGIMSTMTHIRDVRKKAPMVTGLFGPLKDTVLLLKSRGIAMDLPPVNKQASVVRSHYAPTRVRVESERLGAPWACLP